MNHDDSRNMYKKIMHCGSTAETKNSMQYCLYILRESSWFINFIRYY